MYTCTTATSWTRTKSTRIVITSCTIVMVKVDECAAELTEEVLANEHLFGQ